MKKVLKEIIQPFGKVNKTVSNLLIIGWSVLLLFIFQVFHSPIVPAPTKIFSALLTLVENNEQVLGNFWEDYFKSFAVTVQAMLYSIFITMFLVYLSRLPIFSVFAQLASKCRYLTLTGIITLFTFFTSDLDQLKMSILVFGIVPYFTTSFLNIVSTKAVQQQLEKAYINRNTKWQALYEVIIVGKFDELFEVMRQNFAISWMMITTVEAYDMSGGGIGVEIIKSNRHLDLATIFAILIIVLLTGILFDWSLNKLRFTLFNYLN